MMVTASTRLGDDVRALMAMLASPDAPQVKLRSKEIVTWCMGFVMRQGQAWEPPSLADLVSIFELEYGVLTMGKSPQIGEN